MKYISEPKSSRVSTHDGYQLNVWDYGGSGPVLLLCHCTGGLARLWDVVVRHLNAQFHVVAYDTRGHGDSQNLPSREACAWNLSGQDVLSVLDAKGIVEPILAVGHSAGAAHIAYATEMAPERFHKAVLIDAIIGPAFVFQGENPLATSARRRRNVLPNMAEARERFSTKPPKSRWVSDVLDAYLAHGLHKLLDGQVALKLIGESEAWFYEMGGSSDLFERLENLELDTMIITGSESDVAPLAALQHEKMPNSQLRTIEGASHFIPQEKPASLAALINEFFA